MLVLINDISKKQLNVVVNKNIDLHRIEPNVIKDIKFQIKRDIKQDES
jgi:hypothetical protein